MKYWVSLRWNVGSNQRELSSGVQLGYLPWNQTCGGVEVMALVV